MLKQKPNPSLKNYTETNAVIRFFMHKIIIDGTLNHKIRHVSTVLIICNPGNTSVLFVWLNVI